MKFEPVIGLEILVIAALWAFAIYAEGCWFLWLLVSEVTRLHGICMLGIWLVGFTLRSNCTLRWVLVILTLEGALRLGLMGSLLGVIWRAL